MCVPLIMFKFLNVALMHVNVPLLSISLFAYWLTRDPINKTIKAFLILMFLNLLLLLLLVLALVDCLLHYG